MRVERRTPVLARRMVDAFVAEVPVYRQLPEEQLRGDITDICVTNLRIFFRCLRERRAPTAAELEEPRQSAARRAEERVPLDAVLTAYHVGGRIGWQALCDEAGEGEHDELIGYGIWVLDYLRTVTGTVAHAYLEEQQLIYGEERDARRRLAEALLLQGEPAREQAVRAGVQLAGAYLVVALRVGPSRDERERGVLGAVAGRRKLRRVQAALDALAREPVLSLLDVTGGAALLPLDGTARDRRAAADDDVLARGVEVVERLQSAAEAPVLAASAVAVGLSEVPRAWAEAREVRRLAEALGKPPAAYRLDDVLLEHTLTSPADKAVRLARVLEPLDAKPELVETLEAWFAADFDRRSAAGQLNVHPNTLDYRLRRISELARIDVASASGIQLLGAALVARRLERR